MTPTAARHALAEMHRTRDVFTPDDCQRANELIDIMEAAQMATGRQIKVGRGSVRGGKFKPADSTPKPLVKGKHAKAARAAKAWATKSKGKS